MHRSEQPAWPYYPILSILISILSNVITASRVDLIVVKKISLNDDEIFRIITFFMQVYRRNSSEPKNEKFWKFKKNSKKILKKFWKN